MKAVSALSQNVFFSVKVAVRCPYGLTEINLKCNRQNRVFRKILFEASSRFLFIYGYNKDCGIDERYGFGDQSSPPKPVDAEEFSEQPAGRHENDEQSEQRHHHGMNPASECLEGASEDDVE